MDDRDSTLNDGSRPSTDRVPLTSTDTDLIAKEHLTYTERFATSLYEQCLLVAQTISQPRDTIHANDLNKVVSELRLWGALTTIDQFEECLVLSVDVRQEILILLGYIGMDLQELLEQSGAIEKTKKDLSTKLGVLIQKALDLIDEAEVEIKSTEDKNNNTTDDHENDNTADDHEDSGDEDSDNEALESTTRLLENVNSNIRLLQQSTPLVKKMCAMIEASYATEHGHTQSK